jgi:BetI-type transcriptional repressor, C-terminal
VIAAQLRAAQDAGETPAHLDPHLEALSLLAVAAGLAPSILSGVSSPEQAQAVIDYHLDRLFPASQPALRLGSRQFLEGGTDCRVVRPRHGGHQG